MIGVEISEYDRATMKATTLWAVAIIRGQRKEKWREGPRGEEALHIAVVSDVDEIEWCLDEAHADRRVAELRRHPSYLQTKVRKIEMRYSQLLEANVAHELCERLSVAWAERAVEIAKLQKARVR